MKSTLIEKYMYTIYSKSWPIDHMQMGSIVPEHNLSEQTSFAPHFSQVPPFV